MQRCSLETVRLPCNNWQGTEHVIAVLAFMYVEMQVINTIVQVLTQVGDWLPGIFVPRGIKYIQAHQTGNTFNNLPKKSQPLWLMFVNIILILSKRIYGSSVRVTFIAVQGKSTKCLICQCMPLDKAEWSTHSYVFEKQVSKSKKCA